MNPLERDPFEDFVDEINPADDDWLTAFDFCHHGRGLEEECIDCELECGDDEDGFDGLDEDEFL